MQSLYTTWGKNQSCMPYRHPHKLKSVYQNLIKRSTEGRAKKGSDFVA